MYPQAGFGGRGGGDVDGVFDDVFVFFDFDLDFSKFFQKF